MEKAAPQNNYHYNAGLKPHARDLRKRMTKAEACLWKYQLRAGQMKGFKFLRQRPVLNYIADFMCKELMLIIELDGITHDSEVAKLKDQRRDRELEAVGFTVLRFSNLEVLHRMGSVSEMLVRWIEEWERKRE